MCIRGMICWKGLSLCTTAAVPGSAMSTDGEKGYERDSNDLLAVGAKTRHKEAEGIFGCRTK